MRTMLTDKEADRLRLAARTFCGSRRNMDHAVRDICEIMRVDEQTANDMLDNCHSGSDFMRQINCGIVEEPEVDFPNFSQLGPIVYIPLTPHRPSINVTPGTLFVLWLGAVSLLSLFIYATCTN